MTCKHDDAMSLQDKINKVSICLDEINYFNKCLSLFWLSLSCEQFCSLKRCGVCHFLVRCNKLSRCLRGKDQGMQLYINWKDVTLKMTTLQSRTLPAGWRYKL